MIIEVTGYGHYIYVDERDASRPSTIPMCAMPSNIAINRDEIVEKVFSGHGTVGNDNPIAPTSQVRDRSPAEAHLRSGEGQEPAQEGRPETSRSISRSPMPPSPAPSMPRCCSRSMRPGRRHRHQRHPRAGRRLLGQCLAEEAVRRLLLERPADRATGCSPPPMPRTRPGTTRFWKNPRFNELLVAGPLRDRRGQARRDVCRDAAVRA